MASSSKKRSAPKKARPVAVGKLPKLNAQLLKAAQEGDLDRVYEFLSKGANEFDDALLEAAFKGHVEIVFRLAWLGAKGLEDAMVVAAKCGHVDVVEMCNWRFGIPLDDALLAIAGMTLTDKIRIVQDLTGRAANAESLAAVNAGHAEIALMCIKTSQVLDEATRLANISNNEAVIVALTERFQ